MTENKLLIGSLSNDLLRTANLIQRGSNLAAQKFLLEAKKWANQLSNYSQKKYIQNIIQDVRSETELSMKQAEKFLMYSILLQNYALHMN